MYRTYYSCTVPVLYGMAKSGEADSHCGLKLGAKNSHCGFNHCVVLPKTPVPVLLYQYYRYRYCIHI